MPLLSNLHRISSRTAIFAAVAAALGAQSARATDYTFSFGATSHLYAQMTTSSAEGAFVYTPAASLHPTQFSLGYREVAFKIGQQNALVDSLLVDHNTNTDANVDLYAYLAKKDVPFVIGPDGTSYLQDGHHTMASLIQSNQAWKNSLGHIVANFTLASHGATLADRTAAFDTFIHSFGNSYLYGPTGNALTNSPAALPFSQVPSQLYNADPNLRMQSDLYRSLGFGMIYKTGTTVGGFRDTGTFFLEFHWGDLFRGKINWDDTKDDAFYIAVTNANALAHSENTVNLAGTTHASDFGSAPTDYGYTQATAANTFTLNLTNSSSISGEIAPSAISTNNLNANSLAGQTLSVDGNVSHIAAFKVNAGGVAAVVGGSKDGTVVNIPAGSGTVRMNGAVNVGTSEVAAGRLNVNGAMTTTGMAVDAAGVLGGTGTINGPVSIAGKIAPGESVGHLSVNGNVTLNNSATVQLEIASAVSADLLSVTGTLSDGLTAGNHWTLEVTTLAKLPNGPVSFQVATATGGISPSLLADYQLLLPADMTNGSLSIQGNSLMLAATEVPEPAAMSLIGMAGLLLARRRR